MRNRARAGWSEPGQRHRRARVPAVHVRPHGTVSRFGLKTKLRPFTFALQRLPACDKCSIGVRLCDECIEYTRNPIYSVGLGLVQCLSTFVRTRPANTFVNIVPTTSYLNVTVYAWWLGSVRFHCYTSRLEIFIDEYVKLIFPTGTFGPDNVRMRLVDFKHANAALTA